MGTAMTEHEYPSNYPPGTHWAIDAAWQILDTLTPGVLSIEARSLLAGMITGALMKERVEAEELQQVFDMQWEADRRAVKRWQAAHPDRANIWPDRADMVVWLMEQHNNPVPS